MEYNTWRKGRIEEILDINPKQSLKKGETAKKISMEHLLEYTRKIQGFEYKEFKNGSKFKNEDTLMARITPCLENGKTAYVDILNKNEIAFGSTEFFVLRPKEGIADSKFVYYLTISEEIRNVTIQSMTGTSGRQRAQKEAILNYEINIPPFVIQRKIGEYLSLIDEKIETNDQIIFTLEQLAQTLFKRWFIDFEFPNGDGEPYRSSGGKMVGSEFGEIPDGWKIIELGELIKVIDNRGKTPPLSTRKTDFPIIDVKALSGDSRLVNYDKCTKYVERDTYENWFRNGHPLVKDILISTVGSIGELKIFYGDVGCIAQNVVAFRSENISPLYLYQYLKYIKNDLISYNIGSVQPSIKVTHIIKEKVIQSVAEIEEKYNEIVESFTNQIYSLTQESEKLKSVRDSLLPKLLSGEVEIPIRSEEFNHV